MNNTELFAHQKMIADFCVRRLFLEGESGAGVLAGIGSGKSRSILEVIHVLRSLNEVKRVLLVAPLRVAAFTWPNEIVKWGYGFTHIKVNGDPPRSDRYDITICTPDSLHKVQAAAEARVFDLLIVDESPKFKNWTTLRMKNMRKILPYIPKRIIATGSPAANSLADFHGQMFILDDGEALGKNVTVFRAKYMDKGGYKGRQWQMRDKSKDELLERVAPLCIRIEAKDFIDMPELVLNDITCPLPPTAQRAHDTMRDELFAALEENDHVLAGSAAAAYGKCKQLASGFIYDEFKTAKDVHSAKLDALESILEESGGRPILLFYHFKADGERIRKRIGPCAVLEGGQSDKIARKEIDSWFKGKRQVMIAQIQAAGAGLNLQEAKCDTMVFYGLPDSGENYLQAIGRLQRQGGAFRIFVHRLLADGTVDMLVRDRLDGKIETQDDFLERLKAWAKR